MTIYVSVQPTSEHEIRRGTHRAKKPTGGPQQEPPFLGPPGTFPEPLSLLLQAFPDARAERASPPQLPAPSTAGPSWTAWLQQCAAAARWSVRSAATRIRRGLGQYCTRGNVHSAGQVQRFPHQDCSRGEAGLERRRALRERRVWREATENVGRGFISPENHWSVLRPRKTQVRSVSSGCFCYLKVQWFSKYQTNEE